MPKIFLCWIFLLISFPLFGQDSWENILKKKQGKVQVWYYDSTPFIYEKNGKLGGIEYELMNHFFEYLQKKYDIKLEVSFYHANTFQGLYSLICNAKSGVFGLCSFSITPQRKKEVQFSPPYLPDYEILATSPNVPVVNSISEFIQVFNNLTPLNVPKSTFEEDLDSLMKYLPSQKRSDVKNVNEVLNTLNNTTNHFGYVELMPYLEAVQNGSKIKRQHLFKVQRKGYGTIFSLRSDWQKPVQEYFLSEEAKKLSESLTEKYVGKEGKDLVWHLKENSHDEVAFLTKEREIQKLILEQKQLEIESHTFYRNAMLIGIAFLLMFILMIYFQYHNKNKSNNLLKAKNLEIERKNKQITESIIYAQRIQQAMLPPLEIFQEQISDSFLLFMPRDIVSGDFYWFSSDQNAIYAAVADCTGHGVPGAFMSLLGTEILDKIVNENNFSFPADILKELHLNIRKILKQKENNNRDGMDIAFCSIFLSEKKLYFSGAKLPLVYIKNNEIVLIKGTIYSTGGYQRETEQTYQQHEIELDSQIFVYMATDGYQDQFGGEKKQKFLSKNLRKTFLDIHSYDLETQSYILKQKIIDWQKQGCEKQTDDITILGFRI